MRKQLTAIYLALSLAACDVETVGLAYEQTILDTVYSDTRVPEGFYTWDTPDDAFYTTRHIRNGYELSTDIYEVAASWDADTNDNPVININQTDLYFEFVHTNPNSNQFIDRVRVFKRSVMNRDNAELNCDNCYQGTVNPVWLTDENAKFIIEYLWTFTLQNNPFNSVLDTQLKSTTESYVYEMFRAELVFGEPCDSVDLYTNYYEINKATGEIIKHTEFEYSISSRLAGGAPTFCEAQ